MYRRELHKFVGRNNAQRVVGTEPVHKFFHAGVGCLPLRRVYHGHPVIGRFAARIRRNTIAVKDRRHFRFCVSCVVFQNINQLVARMVKVSLRKFRKKIPCKNNIVAVNYEFCCFGPRLKLSFGGKNALFRIGTAFDGPVSPVHYFFKLRVRKPVCTGNASRRRQGNCRSVCRGQIHVFAHFVPWHHKSRSVCAKDRMRRQLHIRFGLVSAFRYDFFGVFALSVSVIYARKRAVSAAVCRNFFCISGKFCNRRTPRKDRKTVVVRFLHKLRMTHLQVVYRSARRRGRHGKPVCVKRFKQNGARAHKSLPKRTQRRFSEIPALRVLRVRSACQKRNFYVRQRCADKHSAQ